MTLRRALLALLFLVLAGASVVAGVRWRSSARADRLARLQSALAAAEAYPRRLAGEYDAAVAETERLDRAIEEVERQESERNVEARRTAARRRQTERIYRILETRRRSAPLAAELTPPRPPGEDDE